MTWIRLQRIAPWPVLVICCASVAQEAPGDVRRALESAAVELSVGRAEAALRALEVVEKAEPDNPWLAYYRGAARLQLDEPYATMADLDRAWTLAEAAPRQDDALRDKIRALRREARRRVLQVSLRLGVAYDSNVSFLGQGAVTRDLIAGEEDELFESRFAVAFAPVMDGGTSLTLGMSAVNSWHFRIDEYDVQEYVGFVRYTRSVGPRTELSFGLSASQVYLGNDSYLTAAAGDVSWRYEWSPSDRTVRWLDSALHAGVEHDDFRFSVDPRLDQDGWVWSVGAVQRFVFGGRASESGGMIGRFGYVYRRFDTQGSEYDRDTHRLLVGLEMPVMNPWRPDVYLILPDKPLWVELTYDWEYARHRHASVLDRRDHARRDRTNTVGITLSQTLIEEPDTDLVLHVIGRYMDSDSNLRFPDGTNPFTFDKYVFGVQFEWTW